MDRQAGTCARALSCWLNSSSMKAAARSPIIMHVACVLPLGGKGMTEASAMRSPLTPCTRSRRSATPSLMEDARRQVPGWG